MRIGGQFYDESAYLTSAVIGEEVLRIDWTSILNGHESELRTLVIIVIVNPSDRWQHENIQTTVTSLIIIGSRRCLNPRDRSVQGYTSIVSNGQYEWFSQTVTYRASTKFSTNCNNSVSLQAIMKCNTAACSARQALSIRVAKIGNFRKRWYIELRKALTRQKVRKS
jgi:hypothetical protein